MTDKRSEVDYDMLQRQLRALLDGESNRLANTANFVALLFDDLPDINWLGVYVLRGDELVLGPFQGKPACVRIPLGKGVCGSAAAQATTLRVDNVHDFDGHIACDPASRSELVVPLVVAGAVLGVLDIDSPTPGRFSGLDQSGVESLCDTFVDSALENFDPGAGFI
ncbi:MAG: GAF domain-containing protein [Gammaproteobacteria bacterium]|nr:GAF domain-containing protein [Gammaproteobacteria bacterium]